MNARKLSPPCAAAVVMLTSLSALAEQSLWLVRPLYPGQEALIERTEKALDKLMPGEARREAVIGMAELGRALAGKKVDQVPCFTLEERCADPINPFMASLGFDRIVLIRGGQDEAGFTYRVVSYEPVSGKVTPASAVNASLEKALLGAVAKVVPAASTLDVKTAPPGATVYIDDVKVGVTPLSTQVLPGERVVRLDLKLHQPVEESVIIPIRGSAALERSLEKVAARIVITASPPGTEISIDGQLLGKDKVDRGILPGSHTIRLAADKHRAFEQQITVKADEQYVLDKTLEPIPGMMVDNRVQTGDGTGVRVVAGPPPEPPRPQTETEKTYDKKAYFQVGFDYTGLLGNTLVGRRWGNAGTGRTESILTAPSARALLGVGAEYGTFGKYFGLTIIGVSYVTNADRWGFSVGYAKGAQPEENDAFEVGPTEIDPVRVHMFTIRALHPQLRFAVWRFMFALQLGFEFRTGQIIEERQDTFYKDGFMILDLLASVKLNVRFFIVSGLYFYGQGSYTQFLIGETTNNDVRSPSSWGASAGFGYAF